MEVNAQYTAEFLAILLAEECNVHVTSGDVTRALENNGNIFCRNENETSLWRKNTALESLAADMQKLSDAIAELGRQAVDSEEETEDQDVDEYEEEYEDEDSFFANARDFQDDAREWQKLALESWEENDLSGVVQAVTGTGKTFVAAWLLQKHFEHGEHCLVLVPSIVLLEQWKTVLEHDLGIEIDSILGGDYGCSFDPAAPITLGVVNSVVNHQDELCRHFDYLIADECHRYGAATFQYALFTGARYRLGLTATFERSDSGVQDTLLPYFDGVCFDYGYEQARRDKVIASYHVLALGVDLDEEELTDYQEAGTLAGRSRHSLIEDFDYPEQIGEFMKQAQSAMASQLGRQTELSRNYVFAISKRKKILSETKAKLDAVPKLRIAFLIAKKTLVFCETIDSAEALTAAVSELGTACETYHSGLRVTERRKILERFQEDETDTRVDCIVAVHALDEGIDVPRVDLGIIMATTKQRRQMIQRMGRIVRKKPGDSGAAIVLVFANSTTEDPESEGAVEQQYHAPLFQNAEQTYSSSLDEITVSKIGLFIHNAINCDTPDSSDEDFSEEDLISGDETGDGQGDRGNHDEELDEDHEQRWDDEDEDCDEEVDELQELADALVDFYYSLYERFLETGAVTLREFLLEYSPNRDLSDKEISLGMEIFAAEDLIVLPLNEDDHERFVCSPGTVILGFNTCEDIAGTILSRLEDIDDDEEW
ncbi:DEAD/DEAH box helicase [bacterium]|nr:DEAD/DEAH box helicase [bacterium]